MARPTARVLTLLELLQSGGLRTKAELADRLGVDERTVRRYVGHLIDLDVPVESVRGRYGGYRLGAGARLPPLMLTDDEALAVLLGLLAGRREGLLTADDTATAKIRRVLPQRLARRLDAVLESLTFTGPPRPVEPPDSAVLLTLAAAVRARQPVAIRYTDRHGRPSARTLHPYGLVVHSGHWYVTGADAALDEDRTFRLDRIADARQLPGVFEPLAGLDPPARVLAGLARAPHEHEVTLRIQATAEHVRGHFPAGLATIGEPEQGWLRADLRVERLDWLPGLLASLDRPFLVERPAELRDLVAALAERLRESARRR
jgi:predicted DNA-binding transcriptional regulator YafY